MLFMGSLFVMAMKSPRSVKTLEKLGRIQLSPSFFLRDFLYSEISQIEGIPNIPEFPDKAVEVGQRLCSDVLEPIQQRFGRISIRSGYRAPAVNAKGAENSNQYSCASNKSNYGGHIWDYDRPDGSRGATACIVVNSVLPYYEATGDWQSLAWWIHDNVESYSTMYFFPKLAAFNINWSTKPEKRIESYVSPRGCLTKPDDENHSGTHDDLYSSLLNNLKL